MVSLQRMSNISVIVAAVVVIGLTLHDRLGVQGTQGTHAQEPLDQIAHARESLNQKFIGKTLALPNTPITGKKATVTLFVSKTCKFCTASMDFYRRLADLRSTQSCDLKVVAVGPKSRETPEDIQEYVAQHDLGVDGVDVVDFSEFGIPGTPTLILRDASRLVRAVWLGRLGESEEEKVFSQIKSYCKA